MAGTESSIWECESGIMAVQVAVVRQLEAMRLAVPRGAPDLQQVYKWCDVNNSTMLLFFPESVRECSGVPLVAPSSVNPPSLTIGRDVSSTCQGILAK
jgi:hypothetical protein